MTTKPSTWLCLLSLFAGAVCATPKLNAADPARPTLVHLLATDPIAAEDGSAMANFTVIRVGPTNTPLVIYYEAGGVASNGVDYEALSGWVEIPAGAFTAPITITPIDDNLVEGTESVILSLMPPPLLPPDYLIDWPYVAFAHIEDNDFAPTNRPPRVAVVNPPDGSVFAAPVDVTLVASASDPDGHVLTVEFFDGANSLGIVTNVNRFIIPAEPLAVNAVDPSFAVSAEAFPDPDLSPRGNPVPIPVNLFRLVWPEVPPGRHLLTAVATDNRGASATSRPIEITVLDAPPQPVVAVWATDPEAAEPDPAGPRFDTATFTIHRTGNTNFPLTVFYHLSGTASNGVDYRELPLMVTIPVGSRAAKVVIAPMDDNLVEGDESVIITLLSPVCIDVFPPPPDCYRVGSPHVARAVIHDNDLPPNLPPVVRLVRPLDGSVFLAPATITLVAQACDFDGWVRTVEFFEGTNSLGIVTNRPILEPIPPDGSALPPPFMLVWSNVPPGAYALTAVATDNDGARGHSRPVAIKVVRHPAPPVVSITAIDAIATEPGVPTVIDTATFAISRTGDTSRDLMVFFSIGGTALLNVDYQLSPGPVPIPVYGANAGGDRVEPLWGNLLIPAGAAFATLVVIPHDDQLAEGTETVCLKLAPPPPIASPLPVEDYIIGTNYYARAIIRDNDVAPTNLPPKVEMVQPPEGAIFPARADIDIGVIVVDPDGYVGHMEFFEGTNCIGVQDIAFFVAPPPGEVQRFSMVWSNVPPGGYVLTAKATDSQGATAVSEPVRIRVVEPSLPPVVTIEATDPYASEGGLNEPILTGGSGAVIVPPTNDIPRIAVFTVRRSTGTNVDLMVGYTVSGTASNGLDYRWLSGRVTIPRGSWTAPITVAPIDDNLVENTETVIVTLEPVYCAATIPSPPGCYIVGDPNRAVAYIRDNDFNLPPKVEIVQPPEGAIFPALANIDIGVIALDPDGWVGKVEFFEGTNRIGVQEIYFFVAPPPGQVQKFSMVWSNVPPGDYALTARATDDKGAKALSDPIHIRVIDISLPVVTIVATDPVAAEQDPLINTPLDTATFTVTRTGDLSLPLRVFYRISGTASNGVDYRALSGDVVIPINAPAAEIRIVPIDDNLVEGTESVILALEQLRCVTTNVPPPEGCYIVGQPGRDVAYIRDNDALPNQPPRVALSSPPNGAVFTAPVDLRVAATADDSDGWVSTVEFFAGTNSLGVTTNHPWIAEPVYFPDLNGAVVPGFSCINPFMLVWSNVPPGRHVLTAVATDNLGASTRSAPVEITVLEATHLPIVNIIATDAFAREGTTNTATFRVHRMGSTNEPLTVFYAIRGTASNGVDYVRIPNSVTIPAGQRSARITIQPIDDNVPEPIETVVLRLQPPPADPPTYGIGWPAGAGAIIVDNDRPLPVTQRLRDGNMHVQLPLPTGMPYRLEASTDLTHWTPLFSNTVSADGFNFVDDESANFSLRFFRVIVDLEPPAMGE